MHEKGVDTGVYLVEWFYTVYARSFTFKTVNKIWDLFLYEGEVVLYKVGLSILRIIGSKIINCDLERCFLLLRSCTENIDEETLMKLVQTNKLT